MKKSKSRIIFLYPSGEDIKQQQSMTDNRFKNIITIKKVESTHWRHQKTDGADHFANECWNADLESAMKNIREWALFPDAIEIRVVDAIEA